MILVAVFHLYCLLLRGVGVLQRTMHRCGGTFYLGFFLAQSLSFLAEVRVNVRPYDLHLCNDRLQRNVLLVKVLRVGVWAPRMELLAPQLMLCWQLLQLLELLVDAAANAGTNVLTLPPPDDGGRGWLPSPGLPEPDSTPSFGHPIHTDDTTKRHTPDLQLFGAWSVDYMSTTARNVYQNVTENRRCSCHYYLVTFLRSCIIIVCS